MGNTISGRGRRPEGRQTAGETAGAAAPLTLIGPRVAISMCVCVFERESIKLYYETFRAISPLSTAHESTSYSQDREEFTSQLAPICARICVVPY
jgi:hypothetical protein